MLLRHQRAGSHDMFRLSKRITRFTALALLALASSTSWGQAPGQAQMDLPRTQLQAGMHLMQVQVASTGRQREIGLMWRKDMPTQEGMLFVFEQPAGQCFWMRNTLIPLTAAFIADDGTIVNLADMQPQNDTSHCSGQPVRFVLEMNQGWFAKRGIRAGQKISGPFFRP